MSVSKSDLRLSIPKLRKQIADHEASLAGLKIKLAKAEAGLSGQPVILCGLDELWKLAPKSARARSSKHLCRKKWNLIPKSERPTIEILLNAMKVWSRCTEWKKDGGQFAPAVDKWIDQRRWEDLPEVADYAPSRARQPVKIIPETAPEDAATAADIAAAFAPLNPRRIRS